MLARCVERSVVRPALCGVPAIQSALRSTPLLLPQVPFVEQRRVVAWDDDVHRNCRRDTTIRARHIHSLHKTCIRHRCWCRRSSIHRNCNHSHRHPYRTDRDTMGDRCTIHPNRPGRNRSHTLMHVGLGPAHPRSVRIHKDCRSLRHIRRRIRNYRRHMIHTRYSRRLRSRNDERNSRQTGGLQTRGVPATGLHSRNRHHIRRRNSPCRNRNRRL